MRVFCEGDTTQHDHLREGARRLGAAFQKVNFLRDIKSDFQERGRVYFPGVDFKAFDPEAKARIEADIQADFDAAYQAILQLPKGARQGVYLAYVYYCTPFQQNKKPSRRPHSGGAHPRSRQPQAGVAGPHIRQVQNRGFDGLKNWLG